MEDQDQNKDDSIKLFMEELRKQYDKEFESRQFLHGKLGHMLSTAGTVTGLLFGFGTFLVSNLSPDYPYLNYTIILLLISIISNIFSLSLSILTQRSTEYRYVLKHFVFFSEKYPEKVKEEYQNFDFNVINQYKNVEIKELRKTIIEEYLSSNKYNHEVNVQTNKMLYISQLIFLFSLSILPVLVILVLYAFSTNAIRVPNS